VTAQILEGYVCSKSILPYRFLCIACNEGGINADLLIGRVEVSTISEGLVSTIRPIFANFEGICDEQFRK
jgi:hypothetical protein